MLLQTAAAGKSSDFTPYNLGFCELRMNIVEKSVMIGGRQTSISLWSIFISHNPKRQPEASVESLADAWGYKQPSLSTAKRPFSDLKVAQKP